MATSSSPSTKDTTAKKVTQPQAALRTGLPTGAGGPIGQENVGTWSLQEQTKAFAEALGGTS